MPPVCLTASEAQRVNALVEKLRFEVGASDHLYVATAEALKALMPCNVAAIYSMNEAGAFTSVGHTLAGPSRTSFRQVPGAHTIPRLRQFRLNGCDPHANRAVNTRELFAGRPEVLAEARRVFLEPNGVRYQLRAVLYDGPRFVANCVLLRDRTRGDFNEREAAVFQAAVPAILDVVTAVRAIGAEPASPDICCMFDSFPEPAYLVSSDGSVAYANVAARLLPSVPAAVRAAGLGRPVPGGPSSTRIDLGGRTFHVVIPRDAAELAHARQQRSLLPPSLWSTARLMAAGNPDKDIAAATGHSLATVRTYAARIYRALDVHSRVELARVVDRMRLPAAPTPAVLAAQAASLRTPAMS